MSGNLKLQVTYGIVYTVNPFFNANFVPLNTNQKTHKFAKKIYSENTYAESLIEELY
jgi:hypothetical protein